MNKKKLTNSKIEELEEEIRVFKKNENACYDMLALYYSLLNQEYVPYSIIFNLAEKLISDLEDKEVSIKLKEDKDVFYIMSDINKKYHETINKYKNIYECKERCRNFYTSYRGDITRKDFINYYKYCDKIDFDLIKILVETSMHSIIEMFLVSNIPFEKRMNIFSDSLISSIEYGNDFELSFELFTKCKIIELRDSFDFNSELASSIINNRKFDRIPYLQSYFNLNSKDISYSYRSNDESLKISLVGIVGYYDKSINNIIDLYESDSYMDLSKEIRTNNDLVILENIKEENISDFISLSHFEVTDEKIDTLVNKIISFYEVDEEEFKQLSKKYLDKWSLAILYKAKNKAEYKEMLEYVKKLEEKVKSKINEIEKERQKLEGYRSLFAVALKELNNKIEERYQKQYSESPKKLRQVLTVEDLNSNKD